MQQLYILDENKRPKEASRLEWHKWMDNVENRRVAQTELHAPLFDEDVLVATVFTGVPCGDGLHLFETFVIGSKYEHDDFSQTHPTWDVAAAIHDSVVAELARVGLTGDGDSAGSECFPFDVADRASTWNGKSEAKGHGTDPGT